MTAESIDLRVIDDATRDAAVSAVDAAKLRGWSQIELREWFAGIGVDLSEYLAARRGQGVSEAAYHSLVRVSITGLPDVPPSRPQTARATDDFPDIPDQMKAARRWLLWKSIPNTDPTKKPRKVPFYVSGRERGLTDGGRVALDAPEDVAQLADYDAACAALAAGGYAGLGFALGPDGEASWQGIDLDNLADHPGLAFLMEDGLPGYLEMSPSGLGVHAIGYGRPFKSLGSNATGIEAYAAGRYLTVTGVSAGQGGIEDLADFVERRLTPLHAPKPQDTRQPSEGGSIEGALAAHDLRSALTSIRADDYHVWIRMGLALKGLGEAGRTLWLEWSQTSDKYDPATASRTWDSLNPTEISYKSVFAEAQERGWANPGAGVAGAVRRQDAEPAAEATTADVAPAFNLKDWTASAYTGEAPPIVWLCEGTIPLAAPVLFASMGGLGKSFIAIDLGLQIALSVTASLKVRPILGGQVVQTGTAVILSAEDSRASIHRRLEAIDPGGRRHENPERLIIVPLPDAGGPRSLIASDGKSLAMTPAFHDLKAQLAEIPDLKLIVIDPLQAFVMADVNADPAAGQFMWSAFASLCAATGATLIVCHHMRKDGAAAIKTADDAREAIRGSTALVDGARLSYALWKAGAEDGRDMCARLDVEYAPERVAFGAVVKANDEADRSIQTYLRQESGLLTDATSDVAATKAVREVSMAQCQEIVSEIGAAWDAAVQGRGEGYALSPQSGERQAWKLVVRRSGCSASEAKSLVAAWVQNGVLQMQEVSKKHHKSALRLVGRIG